MSFWKRMFGGKGGDDAPSGEPADPVAAFWQWWAAHRAEILGDLHNSRAGWIQPLTARVHGIHADLDWEFGPGRRAKHLLALSANGDPRLRPTLERWRLAGPQDDPDFEFYTARQASPGERDGAMEWNGIEVPYADFRFAVEARDHQQRWDIVVHHPKLAALGEAAPNLVFVVLDDLLGEDGVETWMGGIDWTSEPPPDDALDVSALRSLVDGAEERWPELTWIVAQAAHPDTGARIVFSGCAAAKFLKEPLFDTLCMARLPFAADEEGMPLGEEKARVDGFEDALLAELGDRVRVWCRGTGNAERVMWIYLMAENGPDRAALDRLAGEHPGHVELMYSWDPGWRALPL